MAKIVLVEPATQTTEGVMRILASIGTNKTNWKFPPLDLMGIGGILRKNNIDDFVIIDALNRGLTHDQTQKLIEKENPEIVIFTFTIYMIKNDMRVASLTKEISKRIRTMAVNFAAESYPGSILKDFPELDFVAYHEPEYPVLDLVRNNYNPEGVGGIYFRQNGNILKNPERPLFDLDEIGILTHDKIPLNIYRSPYQLRHPMSATSFSRGCVNACTHCIGLYLKCVDESGTQKKQLRLKSIKNCIQELDHITSLGIKELRFFDGALTSDMQWSENLFDEMITRKYDITFSCNVRADSLNDKLLKKMKKAGCHMVSIGIDSVSQEVLDNMKKNLTLKQISESIDMIKKNGMRFTTYTTFGHKGETKKTMLDTIKYIKYISPDLASFTIAVPVKGTEFYDYLKENKYLDESAGLEKYDPSSPPVYSYPDLTSREMYEIAMYGYRSFYFRLSYILKRLSRVYSVWKDLKSLLFFVERYVIEPFKKNRSETL